MALPVMNALGFEVLTGLEERPTTLTLLRHGETEANVSGIYQGITDGPLTIRGRVQAARAAARLNSEVPKATHIVSSPLSRAVETAQCVARALELPVTIDDRLREIDFGIWEGKTYDALHADAKVWAGLRTDPDFLLERGESTREAANRLIAVIKDALKSKQGTHVILVGHGGAFCAGLAAIFCRQSRIGEDFLLENCGITRLVVAGYPQLKLNNYTAHLKVEI